MKKIVIPDNHIIFQLAKEFREQSKEFIDALGIDYFYYIEVDPEHTSVLTMLPECHRAVTEIGLAPTYTMLKEGVHYLPQTEIHKSRAQFNQWFKTFNMLEFILKEVETFKIFGFATDKPNAEKINHYLANMEKFNAFISSFSKTENKLIKKTRTSPIETQQTPDAALSPSPLPQKVKIQIDANRTTTLTARELELLQNLCKGLTLKEAALYLQLSPRTVEAYFNNIKHKLNLFKKSEIISFCFDKNLPLLHSIS